MLLMISPQKQAIQLILSTLLYSCAQTCSTYIPHLQATVLTPTPEGKVPGSLSETGQGLQFTGEDWIPFSSQLFILNQTISLLLLQLHLSHK